MVAMNEIQRVPESVTNAGYGFSYAMWPANSTVKLVNVRWTSDYRDIVNFKSKQGFIQHVNGIPGSASVNIPQVTYVRPFHPVSIPTSFNEVSKYNYLLVHNPGLYGNPSDPGEYYAYFITSVEFVNPSTTRVTLQLDVWQTYGYDVQLGRAYVERSHLTMHPGYIHTPTSDLKLMTTPEGLDIGGEYDVLHNEKFALEASAGSDGTYGHNSSVIVVSTVDLARSGGDINNPVLVSASGNGTINGVPNGADVYFFKSGQLFQSLLTHLQNKPWITQGIISATIVPPYNDAEIGGSTVTVGGVSFKRMTSYPRIKYYKVFDNWVNAIRNALPARAKNMWKFYTYPYTFFEITLYNGQPLVVKPERIGDEKLTIGVANLLTPPNPRIALIPMRYNTRPGTHPGYTDNQVTETGEHLDFAAGINNLPQTSIVNNAYLSYMASNANNIAFLHRQADWSQNRVMASAHTAAAQATKGIDTAAEIADMQNQTMYANMQRSNEGAMQGAIVGGITGTVGGALGGGGLGAVGGVTRGLGRIVETDINNSTNALNTSRNMSLNYRTTRSRNEQAAMVRDSNFRLAEVVSLGDYQNEIASINAKVQDAQMIQPTISGQVGGEAFNFSLDGGFVVRTKIKTVDRNVINMLADFWGRYGYAVNRFINFQELGGFHHRLNCMSNFSYWKLKEVNLVSSKCPETFRQSIRGIFEQGVTVWENPSKIGMTSIDDNEPRDLGYIGL